MKKSVKKTVKGKKITKKVDSKKKVVASKAPLNFWKAFNYPFNRTKGLLNILWILLPIFGWFALGGYGIRIVREFVKGEYEKLPKFSFRSDMRLGVEMFIKSLPFLLAYIFAIILVGELLEILGAVWLIGFIDTFVELLIVPILAINFIVKGKVNSFFEFEIIKVVFENFADYIIAMLKSLLLGIIFIVMWIVLIGLPAGVFTQNIFIADFYRRRVR